MASLILQVPDLDKAIESAKASGGVAGARTVEIRRGPQLRVPQGSGWESDRARDVAAITIGVRWVSDGCQMGVRWVSDTFWANVCRGVK